jgi:hypothetical protein
LGHVILHDSGLIGNAGTGIAQSGVGLSTVLNSSIIDSESSNPGIVTTNASLTLRNSDITNNHVGISNSGGTVSVTNSIVANNNPTGVLGVHNCQSHVTATDANLDDDGTCGFTDARSFSNSQFWISGGGAVFGFPGVGFNGGPTSSLAMDNSPATGDVSPTINAGDVAQCPQTDQRFFLNPLNTSGAPSVCDIGAWSNQAARVTTGPTCAVTGIITGPPKQQQVTVSDPTGIGPEQGMVTDPVQNSGAPAPNTLNNLANSIGGVTITNGTVATPMTPPFPAAGPTAFTQATGIVVTATKTDQTMLTRWSFTATNWAGISALCS